MRGLAKIRAEGKKVRLTTVQKLYLFAYYFRRWLGAAVVLLGIWYILAPSPGEIILPQCEPDGVIANISQLAHGATFWRTQLPYVQKQLFDSQKLGQ